MALDGLRRASLAVKLRFTAKCWFSPADRGARRLEGPDENLTYVRGFWPLKTSRG